MPTNFATFIAHQTTANYSSFANALVLGRPFRQPALTAPTPANFSSGLELFLSSAGDVAAIYAWFAGELEWQAATTANPGDRLILRTGTPNNLNRVAMIEAAPARAVYENVDAAAVQTSLEALLNAAHTAAAATTNQASWHPAMRMQVSDGTTNRTLKDYLDNHSPVSGTVTTLVTDYLAASATAILTIISVDAGDAIGRAGGYLAADPLPTSPPFALGAAADATRARRLTFTAIDRGDQTINPGYYLDRFMRQMLLPAASRTVVSLTNIVTGTALTHPLITLIPAIGTATPPPAREQIGGPRVFPLGDLNTFHTFDNSSRLEWRYDDTLHFVAQAHTGSPTVPPLGSTAAARTKVDNLWTAHGAAIAAICNAFQVPCEMVMALVGSEAVSSLDPRATRFEPLRRTDRTAIAAATAAVAALELPYDHMIGLHATITGSTPQSNGTTDLAVTLDHARTWSTTGVLAGRNVLLLVADADRLVIASNTTSNTASTNYTLRVRDRARSGGFATNATTMPAATSLFHSPNARAAGDAATAAVQEAAARAGTLRQLRVTAGTNSLNGAATVTVFVNGAATALTATIAAGAHAATDLTHTVAVAAGDDIAVSVATAGTTGTIANVRWTFLDAPPAAGDVHVLEGFSVSVPDPWTGGAVIKAGSTLTWDEMVTLLDAVPVIRISPGLLQTLTSTAQAQVTFINSIDPGIFAALSLASPPASAGGYLNDWLLTAAQSLIVGIAYIRSEYRSQRTRFDLPVVGAGYNAGSPVVVAHTLWGLRYYGDYVEHAAPHFNAAVDKFDGTPAPAPAPTVRFMK